MFETARMFIKRIIPCLGYAWRRVVKGVNFENLKDAGILLEIAAYYNEAGADELVLWIYQPRLREGNNAWRCWKGRWKVTIPFIVGGGIRKVEDVRIFEGWCW